MIDGSDGGALLVGHRKTLSHFALMLCAGACFLTVSFSGPLFAQEKAYWLVNGSTVKPSCDGSPQGTPLRAANGGQYWILITAVITCRDLGSDYSLEADQIVVQINPRARGHITRENIDFDWIGLSVYQPQASGETISWIYDEALPIRGSLAKTSNNKIVFGRLKFPPLAKAGLNRATNFTLYLTGEGVMFAFGLL